MAKKPHFSFYSPITVEPLPDYHLLLTFEDKPTEKRVYDVRPDLERVPPLAPLWDEELFKKAYCDGLSVAWSDDLDLCPEDLYDYSIPYEEYLAEKGHTPEKID